MLEYAHEYSKSPYYNNPVSQWVRETTGNYIWTTTHASTLCNEYRNRYYRRHAYEESIIHLALKIPDIPKGELTDFYQAVAPDCKREDPVEAYRIYYCKYKKHICKWKNGNIPGWWI